MRLITCCAGLSFIVALTQVDVAPNLLTEVVNAEEVAAITVDIDIKPGNELNSINLRAKGLVAVAILSSGEFDATEVDPSTVDLAGAGVASKGKSNKLMAHVEDVDGDEVLDLVCQVETQYIDSDLFQDGFAWLLGATFEGVPIEGCDEITVLDQRKQKSRR